MRAGVFRESRQRPADLLYSQAVVPLNTRSDLRVINSDDTDTVLSNSDARVRDDLLNIHA